MTTTPRQRVLVIGTGSIGERHLRCFLATGRADVSFVEVNDARRAEIAARYPSAVAFTDLDAAIARGCDAAVIATPAPLHVSMATRLVHAGIHVLIEKPLAVTLDGVDELLATIRARRVVAAVAYVYRAHPALADMRNAIRSGRFGEPVEIIVVCGSHFPTYRPAYRDIYYASHAAGGGAIQDALTHVLNAAEWIAGPIDRLVADAAHQVLDGVDVEDTVHVIARHGTNKILASYQLNQHQAPYEMTLTVVCRNGTARFEYPNCRWRQMLQPAGTWEDFDFGPMERDDVFIRQANAFLNAIESRAAPACSVEDAVSTLRAQRAIFESLRTQSWQPAGKLK